MRLYLGLGASFLITSTAFATQWCGFNGIYVGMSADSAKMKGFTACSSSEWKGSTDEFCEYEGIKALPTSEIKRMRVTISNGKVRNIYIYTPRSSNYLNDVSTKFGKPTKTKKYGSDKTIFWEKGNEFIALNYLDGEKILEFGRKPEAMK